MTADRLDAADFGRSVAHETAPLTTIETTPDQALAGTHVGTGERGTCGACHRSIGEASPVALRAHKLSDEARWTAAQTLCSACIETHGTIRQPTPGAAELVLAGRLVLRSDVAEQVHYLVFTPDSGRDAVLDYSGPDDC